MKTKEFIENAKTMGYFIREDDYDIEVRNLRNIELRYATVSKDRHKSLWLQSFSYPLIKLCIEYAETPITDREEVKRYSVVLPDDESKCESARTVLAKTEDGRIILNTAKLGNIERLARYHLTEAEIKRNHEYLWQFTKEVPNGKD